jgi:hypothetical protein
MKHVCFWYQFHAVGQGLFTSGHLHELERNRRFHWVFDCGTSSRRTYVQREVDRFKPQLNGDSIGLFCLSHFDEDHINGARELLTKQRVEVLVMPYFPLVKRIQIAFGTPEISDEYLRFLIDPAGYMFAAAGDNLGEIALIAGGGEPPEEGEEGAAQPEPDNPDSDRWVLNYPDTKFTTPPASEDIHGVSGENSWKAIRVFGQRKPFTVGGEWEFIFFNEQIPDSKAEELRQEVAEIIKKYRRTNGSFDGTGLLRELKPLYVRKFGPSGLAQNRISLVTYSGPIENPRTRSSDLCGSLLPVGIEVPPWYEWCRWHLTDTNRLKVSIGYFGDFPLTSPERLRDVRRHFGRRRWNRLQVIQVPHHGSSHSWYDGASGEFQHQASVISSARHSDHHPSQSVLDDLATHGVLLVNELQRAVFCGHVQFR